MTASAQPVRALSCLCKDLLGSPPAGSTLVVSLARRSQPRESHHYLAPFTKASRFLIIIMA